jgi:hypothetical protein
MFWKTVTTILWNGGSLCLQLLNSTHLELVFVNSVKQNATFIINEMVRLPIDWFNLTQYAYDALAVAIQKNHVSIFQAILGPAVEIGVDFLKNHNRLFEISVFSYRFRISDMLLDFPSLVVRVKSTTLFEKSCEFLGFIKRSDSVEDSGSKSNESLVESSSSSNTSMIFKDQAKNSNSTVFDQPKIIMKFIHTPGHTPGSTCILINNTRLVTGGSLQKIIN